MRVLYWILAGLLAALAGLFALGNRSDITVDFWPVGPAVAMPVFVALVGALYLGFTLGAVIAWLAQGHTRKRAREANRRADALARELAEAKAAAAKSVTALTPVAPPGPPV